VLTDKAVKGAAKREKPYKLADGRGLHLYVTPAGGKLWRYRYEIAGKEKLLALGAYPAVSLAAAREARDQARKDLDEGRDPSLEKRIRRAKRASQDATTFEAVAREWHRGRATLWRGRHTAHVLSSLELNVFPALGRVPVREITAPMVLSVLRDIEKRGFNDLAHRVRQRMSAVFTHAVASGIASHDPAAVVRQALLPVQPGQMPAVTTLPEIRTLLREVEEQEGFPIPKLAMRLKALTLLRSTELRGAEWSEFDGLKGSAPTWLVPAERMKMKREHIVPLAPQAVEILDALRPITGRGRLVFPNLRDPSRPMHENTLAFALHRAGYKTVHVPHGWRAAFSTVMNDRYRGDREVIDLMLAHVKGDKVEAAYNRAKHIERRRELARIWADLLLEGRPPAAALLEGNRRDRAKRAA
jgi:integrase